MFYFQIYRDLESDIYLNKQMKKHEESKIALHQCIVKLFLIVILYLKNSDFSIILYH